VIVGLVYGRCKLLRRIGGTQNIWTLRAVLSPLNILCFPVIIYYYCCY